MRDRNEEFANRTYRLKDILNLVQLLVALGVVGGFLSVYFRDSEHIRINTGRLDAIESWQDKIVEEHARFEQELKYADDRLGACCPYYNGHKHQ